MKTIGECRDDKDLGRELDIRFQNAYETQEDELDFYTELLELGITPAHVRRHIGSEYEDHMQEFCREHGLTEKFNSGMQ